MTFEEMTAFQIMGHKPVGPAVSEDDSKHYLDESGSVYLCHDGHKAERVGTE